MKNTGLDKDDLEKILGVFARYPNIEKVILYGSRALGNYKPWSDIDLTMIGQEITRNQLLEITAELDDLLLPWKIDLSIHAKLEDPNLLEAIESHGLLIYNLTSYPKNAGSDKVP